ncbi:hypothetical protein GCM10027297_05790 [Parahaliea aestuarii]
MRNGRIHDSSGFTTTIADTHNSKELTDQIAVFLEHCKTTGIVFPALNLTAELSVGFTVGDSEQFVGSVSFSSYNLSALGEIGITLSVAAYPTSDEANAT